MPGSVQPCPNSAACWSPATPATGTAAPSRSGVVVPNTPLDGRTAGSTASGTSSGCETAFSATVTIGPNSPSRDTVRNARAVRLPSARRHQVTLLNRGRTSDPFSDRVARLRGDRRHDFARLVAGHRFDAAVDFTAYEEPDVSAAIASLDVKAETGKAKYLGCDIKYWNMPAGSKIKLVWHVYEDEEGHEEDDPINKTSGKEQDVQGNGVINAYLQSLDGDFHPGIYECKSEAITSKKVEGGEQAAKIKVGDLSEIKKGKKKSADDDDAPKKKKKSKDDDE